jgi:single-stranded-DNA-specific exonuclease
LLEECSDRLIQFGGHARAAGFTLEARHIESFRTAFIAAARDGRSAAAPERILAADGRLQLQSVGPALADLVARFEPTGEGNPPPTFVSRVSVLRIEDTSNGHLRMRLRDGTGIRKAVAFRPGFPSPAEGSQIEVLYEVSRRYRDDAQQIELVVRDVAQPGHLSSTV